MIESKIKIRKKYMPKGIKVIYDDRDLIVIHKSSGLLSVETDAVKENTAHYLLTNYIRKGNPKAKAELFVVHRLDRDTSGLLIFAKTAEVLDNFIEQWKDVKKTYTALVHGNLKEKSGIIESYLVENSVYRVRSVMDPDVGEYARTGYKVIKESEDYSLLEIDLLTGKKHQIRVHFSEMGHPVVGDKKYGSDSRGRMALHALSIRFKHPFSNEEMFFETRIPRHFWNYFKYRGK